MKNILLTKNIALGMKLNDKGQEVAELQKYLERFGYLQPPVIAKGEEFRMMAPLARASHFDGATEDALSIFQELHGLPVTRQLDEATLQLIQKPRCGVPDKPYAVQRNPSASFVAQGSKWSKNKLTYLFKEFTPDLNAAVVKAVLQNAFRTWALVSPLSFHEKSTSGDIEIRFVSGDHGDGYPFDGVGNVLAHGFYPPPGGGGFAGDLHFDDAETWTTNLPPSGYDLLTVAIHEAGHCLGLDHSLDATAVMYAYYGGARRALLNDDINGIRSIYGTRNRTIWSGIQAAVDGQGPFAGKAYFFKGGQYLRYDWGDDLADPNYPAPIVGNWRGLPASFTTNLDCALNGQGPFAGKLYLFKGNQYVRYDWATDRADPGYPKPIAGNWPGLPASFTNSISAAVSGMAGFAGKAYFFKGGEYVRYDWATDKADLGYPKPITGNWRGLSAGFTSNLDCALNGQGPFAGKLYFFKGGQYARYDWATDKADTGYPLPIEFNWL